MKKIFLSLILTCLFFSAAQANSLLIYNSLLYPITLNFIGVDPSGVTFQTGYITIPSGLNPYANPSVLSPTADVNARIVSAFGFCSPYDIAVGSNNIGVLPSTQYIPSGNLCNNGDDFDIYWNEVPTAPYNVSIVIIP